jgi:transposase
VAALMTRVWKVLDEQDDAGSIVEDGCDDRLGLEQSEDGVMSAPQKYPPEVRDRAVRLVDDLLADDQLQLSVTGACRRVGEQLGINRDRLRGWVKQAQIDAGARPGVSSDYRRRLVELERENRELRRANAILKTASAFSRRSSTAHRHAREAYRRALSRHDR